MTSLLITQPHPKVIQLSLNRPEKKNALNLTLLEELAKALAGIPREIRGLLLKGEGSSFCTGMDLNECCDSNIIEKSANLFATIYERLFTLPLVTLALVHGLTYAGGAGLMLACDSAIGSSDTQIAFPETKRGLVAAQVLTLMQRKLRHSDIYRLLLFNEAVDAQKASQIGLIMHSVPLQDLESVGIKTLLQALEGAPEATRLTKERLKTNISDALKDATDLQIKLRLSPEASEGSKAFLEKRKPNWTT